MRVLCVVRMCVTASDCECMCCRLSPPEPISFQAKTFLKFFPFALKTIQNYAVLMQLWPVSHSLLSEMKLLLFLPSVKEVVECNVFSQVCLSNCWGGVSCTEPGHIPPLCPGPYPLYRALALAPIPDMFKLV